MCGQYHFVEYTQGLQKILTDCFSRTDIGPWWNVLEWTVEVQKKVDLFSLRLLFIKFGSLGAQLTVQMASDHRQEKHTDPEHHHQETSSTTNPQV